MVHCSCEKGGENAKTIVLDSCGQYFAVNERLTMELTYTRVGDYYIPDLTLVDDAEYEIGVYGWMHQRFLEEHHHGTYTSLLLTGKLWKHLASIDAACYERMDFLVQAMAKQEGVTEALKATDQMEWVGRINNIRNRAEKIILYELVFI